MNKFAFIFAFSLGAVVGSAVSLKLVKAKYERIAQEDAASVRAAWEKRMSRIEKDEDVKKTEEQTELDSYKEKVAEVGYATSSNKEVKGGEKVGNGPYVIAPEEFDELDGYKTVTFMYYADGVLTNEDDEIVKDVEGTIGSDSLNHFGEYEDDSVFVRNDKLKCDYEILKDQRKYSSLKKPARPHWEEE